MFQRSSSPWPAAIAWSGFAATLVGLFAHRMWNVLPWERFALSLLLAASALAPAWLAARILRWSLASALLAVWSLAAVYFIGPMAIIAMAILAAAAFAIGARCVAGMPAYAAIAAAVGLTAIGGASGWLLVLPIHTPLFWLFASLAIVVMCRAGLGRAASALATGWREAVSASPRAAACAVTLLGLASTACWFPTLQADDLSYHLALPSQLLTHARYTPMPQHQVWSYAPWLGDTLQGIAFVLARGDARGAVNLLWLAIAAGSAWSVAAVLRVDVRQRWASVALLASFPPLVWLAAGMQTELPAIALLLALAAVLLTPQLTRRLLLATALFAGLLALKPIHALTALPLLACGLWQHRRTLHWRELPAAAALLVLLSGSSYTQSWLRTGNPVLPLFNTIFASPYYPLREHADLRWDAGFDLMLPWRLVFDTARYFESWDGAAGFTLIVLAGATLLAVFDPDTRNVAIAAIVAFAATLLPMQYARYAFPAMVLLMVVALPALHRALGARMSIAFLAALCLLNLAFQANASWLHHSAALKRLLRTGGDASELFVHYAPERELLRRMPASRGIVLATDPARGVIAELAGRGRTVSGHDPALEAARIAADRDAGGRGWQRLIASSRAEWLLLTPAEASPALRAGLLRAGARRVDRAGDAELWRLIPGTPAP